MNKQERSLQQAKRDYGGLVEKGELPPREVSQTWCPRRAKAKEKQFYEGSKEYTDMCLECPYEECVD